MANYIRGFLWKQFKGATNIISQRITCADIWIVIPGPIGWIVFDCFQIIFKINISHMWFKTYNWHVYLHVIYLLRANQINFNS